LRRALNGWFSRRFPSSPVPEIMRPQPVNISVSRLREELWLASPPAAPADGPSAVMGGLFHRTIGSLLNGDAKWSVVLADDNLQDHALLQKHAYERILGPQLTRNEAALKESGRQLLWLWAALGEACKWLCAVLLAARDEGWIRYDAEAALWIGAERLILSEEPLSREFRLPNWRVPVRISGIADAILRDPKSNRWCCIEFKLSDGLDPIDLCQAALYQSLIGNDVAADIALVRFVPECRERVLSVAQLGPATAELLNVAGHLAGVAGSRATPHPGVLDDKTKQEIRQAAQASTAVTNLEKKIIDVLRGFGLETSSAGHPIVGPSFIRFSLKPGRAVPVKKILSRAEDIGVQVGVEPPMIQIEDGVVVVDVSRRDQRETVPFARIRETLPSPDPLQGNSKIPLGVDLNNRVLSIDLAASESPHVLVAGTAGSGKTEWLRAAIAALLLTNTPETLRLVLVDPKHVGFSELARSPFLLHPNALVLPPDGSLIEQLDLLVEEMDRRYREFKQSGADDLRSWRAKTGRPMARIVCVIDEFADMMADSAQRRSLEDRVVRLGAKARAAGIHLVLATQRPDHKTVTGRLNANLSVRVCLRTTTYQQSLVALQRLGAERLLGKGDLFYSLGDRLLRLQAPYLGESERREIFRSSDFTGREP
jgi:S-DNA-T family DNA segregation ATPase FtsK/SpoIIIE